ncbi:MAG TPA: enoyl-CoA hydratase/isomerase family protein [Verrucomicrobiae bacterium]|nr:enoyl-CoA hydratase/isomerase family protein [Verrucomicrobiae bacterium]
MPRSTFQTDESAGIRIVRLCSDDGTNRLTADLVRSLSQAFDQWSSAKIPVILTGNEKFFSAGADLQEIVALNGPSALEFSKIGQHLMQLVENFPAPVFAAISGYCMGGGLDLALACHRRVSSTHAIFGHRGAALGLITGWGGTQRLPRLIGKAKAIEMFVAAEKLTAQQGVGIGLIDAVAADPIAEAFHRIRSSASALP